ARDVTVVQTCALPILQLVLILQHVLGGDEQTVAEPRQERHQCAGGVPVSVRRRSDRLRRGRAAGPGRAACAGLQRPDRGHAADPEPAAAARGGLSMRVIIAGAGSVGRSIARELIGHGHEVTLIDKEPAAMKVSSVSEADWLLADACEISSLSGAQLETCDVVVAATGD